MPPGVDDPRRPSGGNVYDRHLCRALTARGWDVREHLVPGGWPCPDRAARAGLEDLLAGIPTGDVVVLDGLVGSTVPEALEGESARLRLVVLVHTPLGVQADGTTVNLRERRALEACRAVVTTSRWTRRWLVTRYSLPPDRLHVAPPGVDPSVDAGADPDMPTPADSPGRRLLCVAAVSRTKGHDVLVEALTQVADLDWVLVCVGSLEVEPELVRHLRSVLLDHGLSRRVCFAGPLGREAVERGYAAADLLVLASRAETYGMVVTEALAHGLPVLATDVGGVCEALGGGGFSVPSEDPGALAAALRSWLTDPVTRSRLRADARGRRASLTSWDDTAGSVEAALVGAEP